MGRLGKQPALVIELQEQEKSLVIIPTSSSIEWIDWLVSHRSIHTEFFTRDRVDEAFSLICMMRRYILPGPGLLVYMSTLLWLFFRFSVWCLKRKIWRKGSEWQNNRLDIVSILRWPFLPLPLLYLTSRSLGLYSFQTKIPLFSLRRHLFLLREPLQERKAWFNSNCCAYASKRSQSISSNIVDQEKG